MKHLIFYFLLSVIFVYDTNGQIKISNVIIPKVGDTLKTMVLFNVPNGLELGTTGGPKTWNFEHLKSGLKQQEVYQHPSKGKFAGFFTDANLLISSDNFESYLKSSNQVLEGVGFAGMDLFSDSMLVIRYVKRPVLRKTPLEFINPTFSQGEFHINLSTNIFPDSLLRIFPVKPDSVSIRYSNTLRGVTDAYGTLKIHGRNIDVLREKAEIITETKIFIKVLGLWLDPLAIVGNNIPQVLIQFFEKDTTIAYNFYSNIHKEVIVSAQYNTNNVLQEVAFIDLPSNLSSTFEAENFAHPIRLSPNPAVDVIEIRFENFKSARYCRITDLTGKTMHICRISDEDDVFWVDIGDWPQGLYIVNISSSTGSISFSQQFIKK